VDHLLMRCNTGFGVRVDAAYRSAEMEVNLRDRKLKSHIQRKGKRGKRGKPLTDQPRAATGPNPRYGFGLSTSSARKPTTWAAPLGRTTGLVRAEAKIGMKNLAYNMRRLCQLRRLNPNPA
jgi:IS5 family transposase